MQQYLITVAHYGITAFLPLGAVLLLR